jgi:hypothetical protein
MDTLIQIKGILRAPIKVYELWWGFFRVVSRVEKHKAMKFSVTHNRQEELFQVVDKVMADIFRNQGISIILDEGRSTKQVDNIQFWPLHNFTHIEVETKMMSATPYTGTIQ